MLLCPPHNQDLRNPSPLGLWEGRFITWLEENGFVAEYCTSIDLHATPDLLKPYQLLLSVGHDEYWSKEMRDHVEAFISRGGNVAFFGGNTSWWQVRFEDGNRTMVCYKHSDEDPLADETKPGDDATRVTVNWRDPPVNRPENHMTGVSSANGTIRPESDPAVGYRVRRPEHWIFEGTGLRKDDVFGLWKATDGSGTVVDRGVIGYETDAALFEERDGMPHVTGEDGTPLNFLILATAELPDWTAIGKAGKGGYATMGVYRRKGTVFTAATTDWARALSDPSWSAVKQITHNVVSRLQFPHPCLALEDAVETLTGEITALQDVIARAERAETAWPRPHTPAEAAKCLIRLKNRLPVDHESS